MDAKRSPGSAWSGRRMRVDRREGSKVMPAPGSADGVHGAGDGGPASGRVFVTASVLVVLTVWGSLYLAFRYWRSGYRERAAFGAARVASAVDPLSAVVPAGELPGSARAAGSAGSGAIAAAASPLGESPDAWRRAVEQTHAMLVTLTAANLLDLAQMRALGGRVAAGVAAARPETARSVLAALWDEVEARAGPVIRPRHPRPALLPPARASDRS